LCAQELTELSATVAVGRASLGAGPLIDPPASVWRGISDELGLGVAAAANSGGLTDARVDTITRGRKPRAATAPSRRLWISVATAAAVMVLLVVGGGFWLSSLRNPTVLASVELDAFPSWVGARGDAVLEVDDDGDYSIVVTLDAPKSSDSFREVWLINGDATALVSLGVLSESTGTFAVPPGIDLAEYSQVDVSQEPLNGDPTHSGDSIVRGTLRI
jgi:anti-sigma-K factor RskA